MILAYVIIGIFGDYFYPIVIIYSRDNTRQLARVFEKLITSLFWAGTEPELQVITCYSWLTALKLRVFSSLN